VQGNSPAPTSSTPTPAPVQVNKTTAPGAKNLASKALADFKAGSTNLL
jgi:hypothetical protein